ncbi:MAG TPA: PQ-loop repeat-containing protein [Microlunatus sp.]|nr:PQ-loop repeat-containing protein [Microlunatus sp.]
MHELALFAGSAAVAIFMISQLPMLIKACRTKDLTSYSFANIGLANLGNVLYAVYVLQVPPGPVWAIHLFNLTTSGLMLGLYLRYGRDTASAADLGVVTTPNAGEPAVGAVEHGDLVLSDRARG